MVAVVSAGEVLSLGDPSSGARGSYAASTSGGSYGGAVTVGGLTIPDPGVPLIEYANGIPGISPSLIWKTQPSVRKVVDFIARGIAGVPIHTFQRASDTDRKRITDGPIAGTLSAPRGRLIPFRFWHSVLVDWLVFDRWAVMKAASADRIDGGVDLVRIPARRFRFLGDGLEEVQGIKVTGRERPLDPATCLYDHGYASDGSVGGTTPMQAISQVLLEQVEAVRWRRSLWRKGARVPAVITRPKDAPDWNTKRPGQAVSARDRFIASWSDFQRGAGSEGSTPILEDGMELKAVERLSPTDVRDVEFRQLTDAEVAAFFHIPPELVGAREGTYSNIEAFRQMLYGDALGGYFIPLEQVVNRMLVPDLDSVGDRYCEYNIDAKLRGSFESQAKVLSTATGRPFMTSAEARSRLNLRDLGGDTDELVTPLNVTIGGLASPRDTAPDETDL